MKNKIFNENNIKTMSKMPDNYLDGIITSPPYNIATKRKDNYYNNGYSEIDNLSDEEYFDLRISEFKEFTRVVKDDGVILYKATFSTDLVEQLIDIYFEPKSIIYDPFMGIGTTAKGCISKDCVFVGSELFKEIFDESKINIKKYFNENNL